MAAKDGRTNEPGVASTALARCNAYGMWHIYTQKIFTYFRVRFAAFAAAIGGFRLLLSNPRHNFINSGQVINHGEEPSPEIQMPPMNYHLNSLVLQ
jgi:hypothetical protein